MALRVFTVLAPSDGARELAELLPQWPCPGFAAIWERYELPGAHARRLRQRGPRGRGLG